VSKSLVVLVLVFVFLTASCIIVPLPVQAETRTRIVPDDYPTITAAIENSNNGDTIFVRKGTYEGPINQTLVIKKKLSLIGEDASSTKINLHPALVPLVIFTQTFGTYANPIKIEADDVKLSGLTITSDGGSISVAGDAVQITGNILSMGISANGHRIEITRNTITSGRIELSGSQMTISQNILWGIKGITCAGSNYFIASNNITGSSISLYGSFNVVYGNNIATEVNLEGNVNIVARNFIAEGLMFEGSFNTACGNRISSGISIVEGNNNTIYANEGFSPYGIVLRRVENTTFYHNNFEVGYNFELRFWERGVGRIIWDKCGEGNYWSDYNGSDLNFDGIGDTSYTIRALDRNVTTLYPAEGNDGMPYRVHEPKITDKYPLMTPFDISSVTIEMPQWATMPLPSALPMPEIDTTSPIVTVLSPENRTFPVGNLSLTFNINELASRIQYSLDGQEKVTLTGNTTLAGLAEGSHSLVVYVSDLVGNTGVSEIIYFSVDVPFPTTLVIASVITVAIVGIGLLVYFKKRKS
jgi:hypothetical protein